MSTWCCNKCNTPITTVFVEGGTFYLHCPTCDIASNARPLVNISKLAKITKEVITEHEDALRALGDDVEAALQQVRIKVIKDYLTSVYGRPCPSKDLDELPEIRGKGRCAVCEAWELYDEWLEEQK